MRTELEFTSDAFPAFPDEGVPGNPGRHGRRLAEYIAKELPRRGFQVRAIGPKDWGWFIEIENAAFPVTVGCGNVDDAPGEYTCFITPARPMIRRWFFRTIDTRDVVGRLGDALQAILDTSGLVRNLRWLD